MNNISIQSPASSTSNMFTSICLFFVILQTAVINGRSVHHIVDGYQAKQCEFPHIAFVYTKKTNGQFACGGSLIDESHVLTAAHCVSGDVEIVYALFGSLNIQKMTDFIKVSNYTQHEGYVKLEDTVLNDVAILTLSRPVVFNDCLKPIRLAASDEEFVGDCTIAGWGKMGGNLSTSEQLLRANVPLMSKDECSQHATDLEDQHQCAGDASVNGKSTCRGDSGGPLMCTSASDGSIVLVGVTSYGWTCTEGFSVFAKVSYFNDWIKEHSE